MNSQINEFKPGLTARMLELLNYIESYAHDHGFTPSFDEMAEALGLRSKSGVHRLVTALEDRGYIVRRPGAARSIALRQTDVATHRALEIVLSRLALTKSTASELAFHLTVERKTLGGAA